MTVIVVISILITLCTCTLLIWMRDVIHDFEERRARRLQSRRGLQQQRGGVRVGLRPTEHQQHRRIRQNRTAETVGAETTTGASTEDTMTESQAESQAGEHSQDNDGTSPTR